MRARILQLSIALGLFLSLATWITTAQTPQAPPASAVSLHVAGIVLDGATGKPVEGATVGTGKTDTEGRFSVDLRPGAPILAVNKEGYTPGKLNGRSISTSLPSQNVFSITLPTDQPWNDLVIRMNPAASVAGKVFDAQGQPMQDAVVQAFVYVYSPAGTRYRVNVLGNSTKTNDLGAFRFDRVDAGDYYFEIRPSSPDLGRGSMLAPVFYPNATSAANAEAVHVDAGATVQLKNVSPPVVRGAKLSARLVNNTGEEPRAAGSIFVGRNGETGFALASSIAPKEKVFDVQEFGPFAPGRYFVYGGFATNSPGMAETRTYFDMAGNDVQIDLPVVKYKPINVTGRAVIEGGAGDGRPAAGIKLVFHEIGANSTTLSVALAPVSFVSQADGGLLLQGTRALNPTTPPYAYRIRPADLPPGMYVKTIRGIDGDMYIPGTDRDLNLTVTVGTDAGTLEGIAKDLKGAKIPLGVVVLIPDEPNSSLRIATSTTASSGAFKLNAAPGAYHLFAWHEMIGAPYINTEYMSKILDKGVALRIPPNGRVTMDVTAN